MGYKQTEQRRRQPLRQQHRTLPLSEFRSFNVMISIFTIVFIITITISNHNAVVNSENVNHHVRYYHRNQLNHQAAEMSSAGYRKKNNLTSLRGGGNIDANADVAADIKIKGDQELNDEELDEYIEFLLAHADDLASESENPLFRKDNEIDFVNSDKMDEKEYDGKEKVADDIDNFGTAENNNEPNTPSLDNIVKSLLVENVEDEKQLDAMIKTLVASIDDNDDDDEKEEEEEEMQEHRDVEVDMLQEDTISNKKAIIIEKENDDVSITTTALSAETIEDLPQEPICIHEKMTPSIGNDDVGIDVDFDVDDEKLQVNDITPIEQEGPQLADTNVDDGGKESTLDDMILDTLHAVEVVGDERGYDEKQSDKEDNEEIVSFAAADSLLIGSENNDEFKEEQTSNNHEKEYRTLTSIEDDVDVEEEETGELIDTFYLGSSAVESMPLSINGINTSSVSPMGEVEDSTIVIVDSANDQVLVPQLDETTFDKKNSTENVDAPSVKQRPGVWGAVKDFWYKKRGFGNNGNIKSSDDPPVRDYTKIYEKYYAHKTTHNLNNIKENSQEEDKYYMRAFMQPWGTVAKYLKPKIEFVKSESETFASCSTIQYSLGIQPATKNNVYDTHSASRVDSDEISTETEEVFEEIPVTIEETFEEVDQSVDCTENISTAEAFWNKKSFVRLWGTSKVTNETDQEKVTPNLYSLGIQGLKEYTPDIVTDTDIEIYDKEEIIDADSVDEIIKGKEFFLVEEVDDADIAVNIEIPDKVEESFDVYSFDVSESSGESSTEYLEELQQLCGPENHKIATIDINFDSNEKVVSAASETKKQEIEEEIAHSESASIEVNNEFITPEAPNVLINFDDNDDDDDDDDDDDEDALLETENENECMEEGDYLINVDYAANVVVDNDNALSVSESLESVLGEIKEEPSKTELLSDADSAFEAIHEIIDDRRNVVAEEDTAIIVLERDEKFVEEEVEIDEIGRDDVAALSREVDFAEENEDIGEHYNIETDFRNDINDDDDNAIFFDDDSFFEDDEIVGQFNDIGNDIRNNIDDDDDDDEIFETTSKVYDEECNKIHESMSSERISAPSEEMESTNFLWKFLMTKGLEQWIMIAVMISEWFSFYILTPCLDSIDWILECKGKNIFQIGRTSPKWLNARGGALASSTSDNKDASQVELEGDKCQQQGSKEEDTIELDSNEGTDPNSKEQDEQVLPVENENENESESESESESDLEAVFVLLEAVLDTDYTDPVLLETVLVPVVLPVVLPVVSVVVSDRTQHRDQHRIVAVAQQDQRSCYRQCRSHYYIQRYHRVFEDDENESDDDDCCCVPLLLLLHQQYLYVLRLLRHPHTDACVVVYLLLLLLVDVIVEHWKR